MPNNALAHLSMAINTNLNKINKSLRIFFDLIKVYNSIFQTTLIRFVKLIEIDKPFIILKSYLTNRKQQKVRIFTHSKT